MQATPTAGASPVGLTGVPETLLWTLHNRACEAMRPDAVLKDPAAIRLYQAIDYDYDYERSFGKPDGSHALRSLMFDQALKPWLVAHPGGTVVELACGLETQFQRCDDGWVRWLCVDLPESLDVRERLLPPTERCRYLRKSALDLSWIDEVDTSHGVFITAQGLLMYFTQEQVQGLLQAIATRLPGAELMFDTIPPWFSRKTLAGFYNTPHYRAPPMPWGIRRDDIIAHAATLDTASRAHRDRALWLLPRRSVPDAAPVLTRARLAQPAARHRALEVESLALKPATQAF